MWHIEIKDQTHLLTQRDGAFQVVQNTTSHLCDYTTCYSSGTEEFLLSTHKKSHQDVTQNLEYVILLIFPCYSLFYLHPHSTKDVRLILPFINKAIP